MKQIKICIKDILEKEERSIAWLSRQTGISQMSLGKLVANKTDSIRFENILLICEALKVDVKDIIKIIDAP